VLYPPVFNPDGLFEIDPYGGKTTALRVRLAFFAFLGWTIVAFNEAFLIF